MHIFRVCLVSRYAPEQWRQVNVVFILKPGHTTHTVAKSFRPIGLFFVLKTLERLVDRYMGEKVWLTYPLHNNQHEFRRDKSTESSLNQLVTQVEKALENGMIALGAFDSTSVSMCRAAMNHGIEEIITHCLGAMLRNRTVEAAWKNHVAKMVVDGGCPQTGRPFAQIVEPSNRRTGHI